VGMTFFRGHHIGGWEQQNHKPPAIREAESCPPYGKRGKKIKGGNADLLKSVRFKKIVFQAFFFLFRIFIFFWSRSQNNSHELGIQLYFFIYFFIYFFQNN